MTGGGVGWRPTMFASLAGGIGGGLSFMLYMVIYSGSHGQVPAYRILQAVASGVLGGAAFTGGALTAVLGLVLHVLIVMGMAAAFYGAGKLLRFLSRWPLLWGPLYGFGLYVLMYRLVLPYSAYPFPVAILPWSYFYANSIAHMGLGLVIAIAAWWARRRHRSPGSA